MWSVDATIIEKNLIKPNKFSEKILIFMLFINDIHKMSESQG